MKVKIIATIGPATERASSAKKLAENGMNIGRINMKYASLESAEKISAILSKLKCEILVDIENTDKIELIKKLNFDYIALSFTETSQQIKELRKKFRPKNIFVIAKIETKRGIRNIDEIVSEADGVMVARGDLGNNVALTKLPLFQKSIIRKCNKKGKMAITATEMLLSMINSKTPTRAEISDVANAVLDGSDALMLSEETAIGKYPAEAVAIMRETIKETIKDRNLFKWY